MNEPTHSHHSQVQSIDSYQCTHDSNIYINPPIVYIDQSYWGIYQHHVCNLKYYYESFEVVRFFEWWMTCFFQETLNS